MSENNITNVSQEITPELIRDILGLRVSDRFGLFETFSNSVESPTLQDTVDVMIDEINTELAKDITGVEDLGNDLIDSATINGSRTVREAIVALGTSFGTRQKEELSAYFNLLTTVDLSRAKHYVSVDMYDKRLYEFLKNIDGFDKANQANLFRASKVISMADFQAPQMFDIGNNIRRAMFASSEELDSSDSRAGLGITTTALRNFPSDLIGAISTRIDDAPNRDPIDVFNAFLSDFGVRELNDVMAPFISLSSVTMKSTEQQAFLDFYNGDIEIKLHDIKMMPIIQSILHPNRTLCRITFGWTHPDNKTITGALMNLKNTIDVTVSNYSISFDDDMSATITLKFISNAVGNINRQTFLRNNAPQGVVTNQSGIRDRSARLESLLGDVSRQKDSVLERLGPAGEGGSPVATALSASSSVSSFLKLIFDEEDNFEPDSIDFTAITIEGGGVPTGSVAATLAKLREALNLAVTISEDYISLGSAIVEEIWSKGSVRALRLRAEQEGDVALGRLARTWSYPEEVSGQDRLEVLQRAIGQSRGSSAFEDEYAPLSEILNQFFFSPLFQGDAEGLSRGLGGGEVSGADASTAIYFRANGSCGIFSNAPVGSFLIKKSTFQEELENYMRETGKMDITVTDLMQSILSNVFSKKDDVNYGFGVFLDDESNFEDDAKSIEGIARTLSGLDLDPSTRGRLLLQFTFDSERQTSSLNVATINPKIIAIDRRAFTSFNRFSETTQITDPFLNNADLLDAPSEKIFIIYDDNNDDRVRERIENETLYNFSIEISNTDMTAAEKIKLKKGVARRLYPTINLRKNETSIIEDVSVKIGEGDELLETVLMTQQDYATQGGLYQVPGASPLNPDANNFGNPFHFYRMPEVTITTMGLPRLQLHQYMFLDFGSNTNLDNVYYLLPNGLTHKIDSSGFTTQFQLQHTDSFGAEELRSGQNDNGSYEESDELALGNRATNQQNSAVEEFDSISFATLQHATLGYIGDNIQFSPSDARRYMRQTPGGATWSTLQHATLGWLGDHIRIGDRIGEDEPRYSDMTAGNVSEDE